MFEYGVRQEFWHSLALALILLGIMFLGGWALTVLLLLPGGITAVLGLIGYPFLIFALVIILVLSIELIVRVQIRQPIWINPHNWPELYSKVENLAKRVGVEMPKIGIVQNPNFNAFTYGVISPRVVLYSGLVDRFTSEELDFIISHELAHIKYRWVYFIYTLTEVVFRLIILFPASLIILLPLMIVAVPMRIAFLWFNREVEYLMDREALFVTRNPQAAASALAKIGLGVKMVDKMKVYDFQEDIYDRLANLLSTHPLIQDRIREIQRLATSVI